MTLSLHKFAEGFFPGTGDLKDKGVDDGEGFSLNVPLQSGITDDGYFHDLFQPIFDKILEVFQPGAIYLQCGADSLAADRLGTFNLTTKGHARMVDYVKSKNIPLLVAGGGGYTVRNVARVWCYETAVLVDQPDISNELPFHDYYEYYAPTYDLHLLPEKMTDLNPRSETEKIRENLLQQLQDLQGAPSVAMDYLPPLYERKNEKDEIADKLEEANQDAGASEKLQQFTKKRDTAELYDTVD